MKKTEGHQNKGESKRKKVEVVWICHAKRGAPCKKKGDGHSHKSGNKINGKKEHCQPSFHMVVTARRHDTLARWIIPPSGGNRLRLFNYKLK